jgi:predicted amidohydrolase
MQETLTFAGGQIPVSADLKRNVKTLKEAIDYAHSVNADYLTTPEGALSGFITDFDTRDGRTEQDLIDALNEVVAYASSKNVGLFLGTMWLEHEDGEVVRRNQIRVYDKQGNYVDHNNKFFVMPEYEQCVPNDHLKPIAIPEVPQLAILCLMCNDLWGAVLDRGPCLPMMGLDNNYSLMIHATNANRNNTPIHDDVFGDWHNAWLKMMSLYTRMPIITCDNSIHMDGRDYDGPTSSQSGVVAHGVWRTDVPRTGTQYFHYTFDVPRLIFRVSDTDYS